MSRRVSTFVVVVSLVSSSGQLSAQEKPALDAATEAIDAIDYTGAARLIDQALAAGRLNVSDVARAWRLKGIVEASLGNGDAATVAFVELLSVEPGASLPQGLSPRVVEAFDAAKQKARPVRVQCQLDEARRQLVVELDAGSSTRASYVRIERTAEGAAVARNRVTAPVRLALPDVAARFSCFAVDERGNEWAAGPGRDSPLSWEAPEAAGTTPGTTTSVDSGDPGRPVWRNPWIWGSAAGATLAVGATFAILARSDQNEFDDLARTQGEVEYTEAQDVLDRGKRRATTANILFATGGVLAVATAVFIWTQPDDTSETGISQVGAGPSGFSVSGRF